MQRSFYLGRMVAGFVLLLVCSSYGSAHTAAQDEYASVTTSSNQIPFYINLYIKNGLYYELVEDSSYDGAIYTSVFSDDAKFTGRLGAKVFLDGALYGQEGNVPDVSNDIGVRKIRVNTYGAGFLLTPITTGLEFGLANGSFFFNDGFIWFHEVPLVKSAKFGVFTAPMSLESLESSSSIPLMEKASAVSAFAPGDKLGMQIGGATDGGSATLYGGAFSDVIDTESADGSRRAYRFVGRATWLPFDSDSSTNKSHRVHLGASVSLMRSSSDGVQFRSRPESYLAPHLIDTGKIYGDYSSIMGLEAAVQTGPMVLKGEFSHTTVDDSLNQTLDFWGTYLSVGIMLTGETRGYNRLGGRFSGITPKRKFSFSERSWGALEWATRASYTDLSDGSVSGGIMGILSTGLNCYLSSRNRIMFDVGAVNVRETLNDGELFYLQSRLQLEL